MAEQGRKRYTVGEISEAVFTHKDSDRKIDCGSDMEFVPGSEDDSGCKESVLDDNIIILDSSHSQDVENVSRNFSGTYFCV